MPKDSVIKKDPAEPSRSTVGNGKDSKIRCGPSTASQLAQKYT